MEEIHADAGQVVLAKDKRIGYLAQYQDVQGHLSVYEELLSTKQYIIDMEERLRAMEVQMKNASGEELDRLMNSYTRLTHEFELENGYAYKKRTYGCSEWSRILQKRILPNRWRLFPAVRKTRVAPR